MDNCQMEEMGRNQTVLNSLPGEDIGWNRSILDAPNLKFFNTADFVKKSEFRKKDGGKGLFYFHDCIIDDCSFSIETSFLFNCSPIICKLLN